MNTRTRTLAVVTTALLAGSLPHSVALGAEASAAPVIHSEGTARLAADGARPASLEIEYWSAAPRFRIRCRADRALPQRVDFELAFDGARYQLLEGRDEEARLFTAAGGSARTGVVLVAEGGDVRYRLSLSPGRDRLPVRVERLAGGSPSVTVDLLYSEVAHAAGRALLPQALALGLVAEDGSALAARGNIAMQTPRTEAAAADTFALVAQPRGER